MLIHVLACCALSALLQTGAVVERVNVAANGVEANAPSFNVSMTPDARFVAFDTYADNLVAGQSGQHTAVYVRDRVLGTTETQVKLANGSISQLDSFSPSISSDGRVVVFTSRERFVADDLNGVPPDFLGGEDIYWREIGTSNIVRASIQLGGGDSDGASFTPDVSHDGRVIAFGSAATNLVANDSNHASDIFVRDMVAQTTERISLDPNGLDANSYSTAPAISDDGRFVVYFSAASNLVAGDTNGLIDVFVHDRVLGVNLRASVSDSGAQVLTGTPSQFGPAISADGRFVSFNSNSGEFVAGDTNGVDDVFVRDLVLGTTTRASVSTTGLQADFSCLWSSLSADGRFVVFNSFSSLLDPADTNAFTDVFVRDTQLGETHLVSVATDGSSGNAASIVAFDASRRSISSDGNSIVFASYATNLVSHDTGLFGDFYVRDSVSRPSEYCTAKVNSLGCTPVIATAGVPSASSGATFSVSCSTLLNHKTGLAFYGVTSGAALPLQGGFLCVQPPIKRLALAQTGGSAPPVQDCTGSLAYDLNAIIATSQYPALRVGNQVWLQFWSRDPGFAVPNNTNLSAGVSFLIGY